MKFDKLCNVRITNNLTHKEMADKLKISKSYYCQIENGKRNLSYKMAIEISKIFNLKPDDLFYQD